jgi:hypothetical protein
MLHHRVKRMESLLDRRAAMTSSNKRPVIWTVALCVKAVRALITQVDVGPDPFPELEGEDYLASFCPWLLAHSKGWPVWAREFGLRLCGIPSRDAGRLIRRGQSKPEERPMQTPQDVIDLVEEQIEALRAEDSLGTLEKARALGALAAIARKAIDSGKVATRIEMLDAVLQGRKGKLHHER